jgi:hypothetical protein
VELLDQRNWLTHSIVGGDIHPGKAHSVSPSGEASMTASSGCPKAEAAYAGDLTER